MKSIEFETKELLEKEIAALKEKGWKVTGPHTPPNYDKGLFFYASKDAAEAELVEGAPLGEREVQLVCREKKK